MRYWSPSFLGTEGRRRVLLLAAADREARFTPRRRNQRAGSTWGTHGKAWHQKNSRERKSSPVFIFPNETK